MANTNDAAQTVVNWDDFVKAWWNMLLSGQIALPGIGVGGITTPQVGVGVKTGWTGMLFTGLGILLVIVVLVMFMAEETAKRSSVGRAIQSVGNLAKGD